MLKSGLTLQDSVYFGKITTHSFLGSVFSKALRGFVVVWFCFCICKYRRHWPINATSEVLQHIMLTVSKNKCWHCENLERFLFEVLSSTEFKEICTAARNKTSPKFNSHLTMLIYHFKTFTNQYLLITCWRLQIKGNSLKWLVIFCC